MTGHYTQTNRFLGLSTVLGADDLLVRSFSGSEGISRPFHFDLELISENDSIDLEKLIGTNATLRIALADGSPRSWNGYFSRIIQGRRGPVFTSYHAELVPWLWFLGLRLNSRIFQNQTTPDIIGTVFNELGYKDFEFKLDGTPAKRDYCVQYRETDLNFVMRLMEEEGIFFFFEHTPDQHKLIAANSSAAHPICPDQSSVRWRNSAGGRTDADSIEEWQYERQYVSSGSASTDFNFQTPTQNLLTKVSGETPLEIYDQPGNYTDKPRGSALNKIRLEEIQAASALAQGHGDCRCFRAGHRFKLTNHYRSDWNQWYVLTEVGHSATQAGNFMGDEVSADGGLDYQNSFTCIPYEKTFRPLRRSPVPVVEGCQTAIVVGPKGEEIYTDEFGRIKVQFHWDRAGTGDQNSSCWIRVAQSWAGQGWGVIAIPRVGQEVVVEFLEGDPDRPLVTGCVYNAQTTVPYDLPSNKDMTGIRSNSTKNGEGYSEIVIRDRKGAELLRLRAQKDMDTTILNNDSQNVSADRTIVVGGKHNEEVKREIVIKSSGDQIYIEAATQITLAVGESSLFMDKNGNIILKGKHVTVLGSQMIDLNP